MTDAKRSRGKNFLDSEKEMLIDLIIPHKSIIENIKTDNATNKTKDQIWEQVTVGYNTLQKSGIRSKNQLKNVYDNLKTVTRKENSDNKVKSYMDFKKKSLLNSFSQSDKEVLVDLMIPYKESLDIEKNSEFGNLIWQEVCDLYNSQTTNPKTIKEICDIYEIIKTEAKLNRNAEKKSIYKTGGGKGDCSISTPGQDKILDFIGDRMDPLENQLDSDTEYLELIRRSRKNVETSTKSVDDNFDIVELGIEQTYDSFHSSDQLNFSMANETITAIDERSELIIPGYLDQLNPYCDKIKQNSSNEKRSTTKKLKSNDPVAAPKSTGIDTDERSEIIIPGYLDQLNPYCDKIILRTPKPGLHIPFSMQNKKQKTESERCAKYAKYEYKKSSYAETHGVLQSLRQDGVFCDIKLKADDSKIIIAHNVVLSAASPYFYAMFTNFSERNHELVVMREIDSTVLQVLVNFIYSGEILVNEENVKDLLPAANLLQLQEVKEVCCDFLNSQLCPTNCIGIYTISDIYREVVGGDEFLSLSSDQVIKLISSDKRTVPSEEKVFESVIRWVKYESGSRKCILPQLMEHVRLPLISQDYILKKVVEEPLIKNCYKCKDYIIDTLHFHILKSEELIPQNIRYKPRHGDKVILVVSRFDTNECISTTFYEPKISRWNNGLEMITNRNNAGLAVVKENLVFTVGGATDYFHKLQSVDVLDLSSKSPCWESSVDMLVKRNILGVGVINNDLYAVGGYNEIDLELDSAEVFDFNTQKWRMISSMSTRRSSLGVGVLNNLLYAVGGSVRSWKLNTVECYDPSLDTWIEVKNMSVRRGGVGVGVLDGVLYAVGGHSGSNRLSSAEAYTPSTEVWTTIADMHFSRFGAGVVAVDGLLYVFGGSDKSHIEDSTECYNPKTNTWTIVAPLWIHEGFYASARVVAINRPQHLKTC